MSDQFSDVEFRIAGHTDPKLVMNLRRVMCGHIADGVSLQNGDGTGSWVLSFADLEQAYLRAKEYRSTNPPTQEEQRMANLISKQVKP